MRRALVTGVSRGIGRAVTEMLLGEGWAVIGVSRMIPARFPDESQLMWVSDDVATGSAIAACLSALDGPLDALVHCAGARGPYGAFLENRQDAWEATIQTNLIGTARILRAALPLLQRSDDGRILLFSGGGAFSPEPFYSAYASTKGATVSLMEALSEELAGSRITINCVAPGFIATEIHRGTPHEHRKAEPDALANVVACVRHLLAPATQGLNGRTISAQFDDWISIDQTTIGAVNASDMGMRDRHKIQCVRSLVRPRRLAAV